MVAVGLMLQSECRGFAREAILAVGSARQAGRSWVPVLTPNLLGCVFAKPGWCGTRAALEGSDSGPAEALIPNLPHAPHKSEHAARVRVPPGYDPRPVDGRGNGAAARPGDGRGRLARAVGPDVGTEFRVAEGLLLLERVAAGDPGGVRECIDRFGGLVWSLARRMTLTNAEAEDAVQEIFVEIWRNAGRYDRTIASETAFIAMIARRRLIDRRRRLDRQKDRANLPEEFVGAVDPAADSPSIAEEAGVAREALTKLSSEQQRVLRLSIYEGLSHEKIAVATGLPLGTVKTHARRGLIKIRELLGLGKAVPEEDAQPLDTARGRDTGVLP